MESKLKLNIVDRAEVRREIDELTNQTSQVDLSKWAISIAQHAYLALTNDFPYKAKLESEINVNKQWQQGRATVHQVRQAGFSVHKIARECEDETTKAVIRAIGQAISTGHMKAHALIASDYAIKAVGLYSNDNLHLITEERTWQLAELKKIHN
ncbi:putative immunity protein [Planococcus versutus]|uniref:Imm-5-like domain-containing protein n=1 Tax=Planococcus versutus TaxID=1302659 RepID=A0A1B1S5R1_9BACL|nr:hypothetical protein [Planococcus versutus]ANU28528.1 hypothetical protein I858_016195 [Planococcus versutus]